MNWRDWFAFKYDDNPHWIEVVLRGLPLWLALGLFLVGVASCALDHLQRTPEPCTLACER